MEAKASTLGPRSSSRWRPESTRTPTPYKAKDFHHGAVSHGGRTRTTAAVWSLQALISGFSGYFISSRLQEQPGFRAGSPCWPSSGSCWHW